MVTIDKEIIHFVSEKMKISPIEAESALATTDKEIDAVLSGVEGNFSVAHDLQPERVNISEIASNLGLKEKDFTTWTEDNMVWVLHGRDIMEGTAGEGPTPQMAVADFYRRWYTDRVKE